MTDELVFYTHPMSRGRIVRWMLEEIGRPYRAEILDYGTTMKAPAYLAINPMGKVPALRHGDAIVTETAAICAYLADAFPDAGLAPPPGDRLRAPYYRWLFFAAGPLEAAATNKVMGFAVPPGREMMMGYGTYEAVIDALEGALVGPRIPRRRAVSRRPMSISDRISASAWSSARSRSARSSRAIGSASLPGRRRCAPGRSTTR